MEIKVHHCEKAFKDKNGKIWYNAYFEIDEFEFAWIRTDTPYQPGAVLKVKLGKIISQDYNNGRITLIRA